MPLIQATPHMYQKRTFVMDPVMLPPNFDKVIDGCGNNSSLLYHHYDCQLEKLFKKEILLFY